MNQEMRMQTGFGQDTGHLAVCPECRKPLPRPDGNQLVLVCSNCRTETEIMQPLLSIDERILRIDETAVAAKDVAMSSNLGGNSEVEINAFDDEFELKLEPESERPVPGTSVIGLHVGMSPSSLSAEDQNLRSSTKPYVSRNSDFESRTEQAKQAYNDTLGLYPRERIYPTLEAMQRLYRLFGYIAVMCVFPYIAFRFVYLLFTTKEQHLQVFAEFSEFAVPVLFGCVALTASLFAASEGIKLAMDIQDNTLRIANSSGRNRMK